MISTAITDLWYGFGVALEPHKRMYCFLGVLVGTLGGVRAGRGPWQTGSSAARRFISRRRALVVRRAWPGDPDLEAVGMSL